MVECDDFCGGCGEGWQGWYICWWMLSFVWYCVCVVNVVVVVVVVVVVAVVAGNLFNICGSCW